MQAFICHDIVTCDKLSINKFNLHNKISLKVFDGNITIGTK